MNSEIDRFYSHGKLLLTGEYLVMYGSKSLALPVKFGQEMKVIQSNRNTLKWEAFIKENSWFEAEFTVPGIEIISSSDQEKALYLKRVIQAAKEANPFFLTNQNGFLVKNHLEYLQEWGLGSSSTFINNLARWAQIDPFDLHHRISGGSGYDIACAGAESPITFQISEGKPHWQEINYHPPFSDNLYFIFLGEKKNTNESIRVFKEYYKANTQDVEFISGLTEQWLKAENLSMAIHLLNTHEAFMGNLLKTDPVKQLLFPDFKGAVKSLGAWGGDFVMAASPLDFEEVKSYFRKNNFNTIFKYEDIVLNKYLDFKS